MLNYPQIDPVAFAIGPLKIRWYGISYIVGILLAWWLLRFRASKKPELNWNNDQIADLVFYATIGIIIGGRLGSVLFYNLPYYLDHPLNIIKIWKGGMSFHGGLLGVLIAIWFYSRSISKHFFETADFIAPVIPVGLFFGRIANFINGELWGRPTDIAWGMVFPHVDQLARHPSQLYQALMEGVLLFVILWCYSSRQQPRMAVSGLFLIGYGLFRFLVEFAREPDRQIGYVAFDWLTMGQVLSVPMFIIGVFLIWMAYRKQENVARG